MAVTAPQSAITGLPRRLVQDGILSEDALIDAMEAAKEEKVNLVAHLVANDLASAKDVAVAASHEFGVPLMDLEAMELDLDVVRLVDEKLLSKHRVLPLVRRDRQQHRGRHGTSQSCPEHAVGGRFGVALYLQCQYKRIDRRWSSSGHD